MLTLSDRNLTTKDILQKEFKPALRGFNTADVDEFLDLIIRDYESYEKEIAYLTSEVDRLKRSTSSDDSGRSARSKTKNNAAITGTTNYDILRRLSKLEKEVFGAQNRASMEAQSQSDKPELLSRGEAASVNGDADDTILYRNN